jgi:hypothetical protein
MNLINSYDVGSSSYAQEYQDVVQQKENRYNSLNKLVVKRELISDAIAKSKPKN